MRLLTIATGVVAAWLLGELPAAAQMDDVWRAGARVNVTAVDHENVWAVGAIVSVRGTAKSKLGALGAEVDVDAVSAGHAYAAGAILNAKITTAQDLYVAGARVNVDARVGRDLYVAGARVVIAPTTEVRGETRIVGADLVFAGTSQGPVTLYGDSVQIDGRVTGNVLVRARQVHVGKAAVIDGAITFETFGEPTIDPAATVRGRQTVTLPRAPEPPGTGSIFAVLGVMFVFAVGAGLVLGLLLLIVARPFVERAVVAMRSAPLNSALVGLLVLILVPVVAIVLMVTIVGIPVALLALLAFPLMLLTAGVLAAFGISDWLLNRERTPRSFGGRLLLLIVGLIALTLLGLVPIIGFLTWVLAVLIGLGAFWRALRAEPQAVATAAPA